LQKSREGAHALKPTTRLIAGRSGPSPWRPSSWRPCATAGSRGRRWGGGRRGGGGGGG
jgi:hypothetical protein